MSAMDRQHDPGVELSPVSRPRSRWLAVFAISAIATVALVIAKPWGGLVVGEARPSPAALVLIGPAATARPTPQPVTGSSPDGQAWFLDFDRSGISPVVCMGWEGSICPSEGQLASSIQFRDGQMISGGTGVGGGCDQFTGSLDVWDQELGLVSIIIPTYESRCYDTGVDREIRDRLNRAFRWHLALGPTPEKPFLVFLDPDGTELLVYHQ